jgi:plastocyanin
MKRTFLVASAALAALAAFAALPATAPAAGKDYKVVAVQNGGTIRGTVRIKADVDLPPLKITKDNDRGCGAPEQGTERLVYDRASKGVGNVLVTLKGVGSGKDWPEKMRADDRTLLIDQKGCRYAPHVQWGRPGTQLVVANDDRADHNIHGYKGSMKDTKFNFSSEPGTKKDDIEQAFLEEPANYILKCDIHPWMSAYVHILDNPYADVTSDKDADGRKAGEFVLSDVPEGEYVLVFWKEGVFETPSIADGKITAYTYSPDITWEVPVKVEAGKTLEVPADKTEFEAKK